MGKMKAESGLIGKEREYAGKRECDMQKQWRITRDTYSGAVTTQSCFQLTTESIALAFTGFESACRVADSKICLQCPDLNYEDVNCQIFEIRCPRTGNQISNTAFINILMEF